MQNHRRGGSFWNRAKTTGLAALVAINSFLTPSINLAEPRIVYDKTQTITLTDTDGNPTRDEEINVKFTVNDDTDEVKLGVYTQNYNEPKEPNKETRGNPLHLNLAFQDTGLLILSPTEARIGDIEQKAFTVSKLPFVTKYQWEDLKPIEETTTTRILFKGGQKLIDLFTKKIPHLNKAYKELIEFFEKGNDEFYGSILEAKDSYTVTMIPFESVEVPLGKTLTAWEGTIPFDTSKMEGKKPFAIWINPAFGSPRATHEEGTISPGQGRIKPVSLEFILTGGEKIPELIIFEDKDALVKSEYPSTEILDKARSKKRSQLRLFSKNPIEETSDVTGECSLEEYQDNGNILPENIWDLKEGIIYVTRTPPRGPAPSLEFRMWRKDPEIKERIMVVNSKNQRVPVETIREQYQIIMNPSAREILRRGKFSPVIYVTSNLGDEEVSHMWKYLGERKGDRIYLRGDAFQVKNCDRIPVLKDFRDNKKAFPFFIVSKNTPEQKRDSPLLFFSKGMNIGRMREGRPQNFSIYFEPVLENSEGNQEYFTITKQVETITEINRTRTDLRTGIVFVSEDGRRGPGVYPLAIDEEQIPFINKYYNAE